MTVGDLVSILSNYFGLRGPGDWASEGGVHKAIYM